MKNEQKPAPSAAETATDTDRKVLGLLGFAARARKLIVGASQVCEALGTGKAPLIVVEAGDTSAATHKRLSDKTSYYHTPRARLTVSATALAAAVGKKEAAVAAVGVTEPHIAAEIGRLTENI